MYFTDADQKRIVDLAAEKMSAGQSLESVMRDFYSHQYWGFHGSYQPISKDPTKPPQSPSVAQQLWPYIRALLLSALIMKSIVYFLGLQASKDPTTENWLMFAVAMALSLGSLIYFAWKQS